jgi:AcrR family transcriptional regulator
LPSATTNTMQPRKTPVQARSAVTVDAILEATLQVLIAVGKERLTTMRVASRAGVSVGTLYQYFPNKSALLQACLKRHMDEVSGAIEEVCERYKAKGLLEMGTALIVAYLNAKMHDMKASVTLYAVSSDVDGAAIAKATSARCHRAVAHLFASSNERLTKDPDVIATIVFAVMNGVARRLLETKSPERDLVPLREELIALVHAYLRTCAASPPATQAMG